MRRLLTFVLIVGLLLNLQALRGLCGDCCSNPVHTCSATPDGMVHCPMHTSQHSIQMSKKTCSCAAPAGIISISETTSSLSGQHETKLLAVSPLEFSYAAGLLITVRSRPKVHNPDPFPILRDTNQPLPLRI